jgi:hypothetical protein
MAVVEKAVSGRWADAITRAIKISVREQTLHPPIKREGWRFICCNYFDVKFYGL